MCDFQSELSDTHSWYGQNLLGSDQSGNDLKNCTVNMIVNGFKLKNSKFNFSKFSIITIVFQRLSWIWIVKSIQRDVLVENTVENMIWSDLFRIDQ